MTLTIILTSFAASILGGIIGAGAFWIMLTRRRDDYHGWE